MGSADRAEARSAEENFKNMRTRRAVEGSDADAKEASSAPA